MLDILYTDTDKVRAALGMSDIELSDAQIKSAGVLNQLTLDLATVCPTHAVLYNASRANGASDTEKRLGMALELYAQYACASYLTPQLQMIAAQKITDGDFEMQRFIKDNLNDTIARIAGVRDKYARILTDGTGITTPGAVFTLMGVSSPGYDPVLGA